MNNIPISKLAVTYGKVKKHKYIGDIIKGHSTNSISIDSIAYKDISFINPIKVVDIGCGFGRCINKLSNIIPKKSEYIGIDPLNSNKSQFLKKTELAGFIGKYICGTADDISIFPNGTFDLILCNYSLYFFIDKLPLITKKLQSNGIFITITHSINSLCDLLEDLQVVLMLDHIPNWHELGSEQIIDNFNAENGRELLQPHFNKIEKIVYKNNLEFYEKDIDILFDFLDFLKTTLIHHNNYTEQIMTKKFDEKLRNTVANKINRKGKYILNKNDVIFRCLNPKT